MTVHTELKLLRALTENGSDDDVGMVLTAMRGERMIVLHEHLGGSVHVKVGRVAAFQRHRVGTLLTFTPPTPRDKGPLLVRESVPEVENALREAGWIDPSRPPKPQKGKGK